MDIVIADSFQTIETGSKILKGNHLKMLIQDVNFEPTPDPYEANKIGEGSYGTVYYIDGKVHKKMEFCTDDGCVNIDNLSEVMMMSTFNAPFIPRVYSADIEENNIVLVQEYCGKDLFDLGEIIPESARYKMAPYILVQMSRILMWLKRHNISHMDIKPENLCLNKEGKLYLIDWGFATPVYRNTSKYHGTEKFGDPHYFNFEMPASFEYDLMGMGLSLYNFLSQHSPNKSKWVDIPNHSEDVKQEKVWKLLKELGNIEKNLQINLGKYVGNTIFNILKSMLDINEEERVRCHSIYTNPIFRELWKEYPIFRDNLFCNNPLFPRNFSGYHSFLVKRGSITLFENNPEVQALGVQIFYRYQKEVDNPCYLFASIYIASMIYKQSTVNDRDIIHYRKYIVDILKELSWVFFFNKYLDCRKDFQEFLQQ